MKTVNTAWFPCPPPTAFRLACRVDRWPDVLPHYRWVRFHRGTPDTGGLVEMAARREFSRFFPWPVWWVSRMTIDPVGLTVRYTHVDGITRGMEVEWAIEPAGSGSRVSVVHDWAGGPRFAGPARGLVARQIIGPLFIHHVAGETLKYLAEHAAAMRGVAL